jgi:hypothetical protein
MKTLTKAFSVFVICLVSISAAWLLASVNINIISKHARAPYIEVAGPEIAYIPFNTNYVKYKGEVRRILRIEPYREQVATDCQCPKCCSGSCYIIVYSDTIILSEPIRTLYLIWIDC